MPLEIIPYILGPLSNNTYLVADAASRKAVIIDPSFDCEPVVNELKTRNWELQAIWLTHGHFDHRAGVNIVLNQMDAPVKIGMHPADLSLYRSRTSALQFGYLVHPGPDPDFEFIDGQILSLGDRQIEVRHVPGHSPGHVVFYAQSEVVVFCGDVIFQGSIGRTDFPGGNLIQLLGGIREKLFSLPDKTRLLPGHGPETTIADEKRFNPYVKT
jgi:hydroxyacylglutathione hydrolase